MPKPIPKRPPTSGTRKGNGAGWGGQAKGASTSTASKQPDFQPGNQAARGYHDMSKAERLAALDERKWLIGMGLVADAQPVHMAAINSFEDRHQGKVRQNVGLTDPDGGPLHVIYTWDDGEPNDPEASATV